MAQKKYPEMHWTPDKVARFWDWQSQQPEAYFTYLFGAEIARFLERFLQGRGSVLDYGCGVGYLLPHLCRYAPRVYGADPSRESVARSNERLAGTQGFQGAFTVADLRARGLAFDAILAIEVIEHLYDPELEIMLGDVRAMLASGGIAIFTTPNDEDREKNMVISPETGEVFHRWQHVRSWNHDTLPARLREAGFEIHEVRETNLALSRSTTLLGCLKMLAKRVLFGASGKPHLVCVASRRVPAGR
jgi:2-polyprenyl-3-methyl-5-hydroxy-6-metoxy-1,4-benzoquinol methylase